MTDARPPQLGGDVEPSRPDAPQDPLLLAGDDPQARRRVCLLYTSRCV
ncbi:hypothetical protein [Streptomyces fragilis]|nr:hypothetical protein [Streptomyces fragilis]